MQNKRKLIGLAGLARSGKDTFAEYLSQALHFEGNGFFHKYAFADPLKRSASEMFGIELSVFYGGDEREKIDPHWGISPREMLQKLGTEGGREIFGHDLWIKRAAYVYKKDSKQHFLITDVRFEDEASWIRDNGGIIIHISRENGKAEVLSHASETGVEIKPEDIVIDNNGSLRDLKGNAYDVLEGQGYFAKS